MTDFAKSQLSSAGEHRREQMLPELIKDMRQVHRSRRVRRRSVAGVALIMLLSLLVFPWLMVSGPNPVVTVEGSGEPTQSPNLASTRLQIVRVNTIDGIARQFTSSAVPHALRLSDDALLAELASLNRNVGLIRSEGRAWLTADVADHQPDDSAS